MRKYKFRQQTFKEFFKKHGFKFAVLASVLGLSIAAYSAIGAVNDILTPQPGGTQSEQTGQVVSGITDDVSDTSDIQSSGGTSSDNDVSSSDTGSTDDPPASSEPDEPETPTLEYPEYFYTPVNGKIGKEYSDSTPVFSVTMGDWRVHSGTDFTAETGERVISVAAGIVTDVRYDEAWGWIVDVDHGGGLEASYRNLNDDVQVEAGDVLKAGQLIGGVGAGGYEECGDGSHLHLEMKLGGQFVDPVAIMNKKTA